MYTNQKKYIVIRNVCTNNNLRKYLEQICHEEGVHIHEEYVSSNWFAQQDKVSLYAQLNAKPSFDIILESYNYDKLKYIEYLYNKYKRAYREMANVFDDNGLAKSLADYPTERIQDGSIEKAKADNDSRLLWVNEFQDDDYIKPIGPSFYTEFENAYTQGAWTLDKKKQSRLEKFKQKVKGLLAKYDLEIIYMSIGFFAGILSGILGMILHLTFK